MDNSLAPPFEGCCLQAIYRPCPVLSEATGIRCSGRESQMMMIALITINSGLVPLIEGLCAQILYLRFEIHCIARLHDFLKTRLYHDGGAHGLYR